MFNPYDIAYWHPLAEAIHEWASTSAEPLCSYRHDFERNDWRILQMAEDILRHWRDHGTDAQVEDACRLWPHLRLEIARDALAEVVRQRFARKEEFHA